MWPNSRYIALLKTIKTLVCACSMSVYFNLQQYINKSKQLSYLQGAQQCHCLPQRRHRIASRSRHGYKGSKLASQRVAPMIYIRKMMAQSLKGFIYICKRILEEIWAHPGFKLPKRCYELLLLIGHPNDLDGLCSIYKHTFIHSCPRMHIIFSSISQIRD